MQSSVDMNGCAVVASWISKKKMLAWLSRPILLFLSGIESGLKVKYRITSEMTGGIHPVIPAVGNNLTCNTLCKPVVMHSNFNLRLLSAP